MSCASRIGVTCCYIRGRIECEPQEGLMKADRTFALQVAELSAAVEELVDNSSDVEIEETAKRLEGLNYAPPVITPIGCFLRMKKGGILGEIERISVMPEAEACALAPNDQRKCEDLRLQYMSVVIYYYKKLLALRNNVVEEWDEVDELYVHD